MIKSGLLITGGKGLVGSKFVEQYANEYLIEPLDVSDPQNPVDITNGTKVHELFEKSSAEVVIHCAAYTDVTGAWEQRGDTDGVAYKVNVEGTTNIVTAAQDTGKHVIHISTAYVFDGLKEGKYHEDDPVNPIEWYGYTKAKAEEIVLSSSTPTTVLRIDQPFRSDIFARDDLVRKIIKNIISEKPYPLFTDHYIGPTFIDDFVKVLDWAVRTKTTGLFHASSGERISDYELAQLINRVHRLNGTIVEGRLDSYLKTLNRPYQKNTSLDIGKLVSVLDFELNTLKVAIASIKI